MRRWYANERRQGKAFEVGGIGRRKAKPGRILRPVRPISNRECLRVCEKNDCPSTKLRANGNYIDNVDTHGLTPVALEMQNQQKPLPAFGGFHPQANAWGPQPGV